MPCENYNLAQRNFETQAFLLSFLLHTVNISVATTHYLLIILVVLIATPASRPGQKAAPDPEEGSRPVIQNLRQVAALG